MPAKLVGARSLRDINLLEEGSSRSCLLLFLTRIAEPRKKLQLMKFL